MVEGEVDDRLGSAQEDLRRLPGHDPVDIGRAVGERGAAQLAHVVGAVGTDGHGGRDRVGRPSGARGEDGERRDLPSGSIRNSELPPASVTMRRPGSAGARKDCCRERCVWVECRLERGDVGDETPAPAGRDVDQLSEAHPHPGELVSARRIGLEPDREIGTAATEEGDVGGPPGPPLGPVIDGSPWRRAPARLAEPRYRAARPVAGALGFRR